jgi:predicted nuclease of predicted toxin-antitoxin system
MRVILDECLPRRLLRDLPDHVVTTVPRQGWAGVTNGALLERVQNDEFDVFITMDSNLVHQQNLDGLKTCLVVLHAVNSRYETLQPLLPQIQDAISKAAPGSVFHIKD